MLTHPPHSIRIVKKNKWIIVNLYYQARIILSYASIKSSHHISININKYSLTLQHMHMINVKMVIDCRICIFIHLSTMGTFFPKSFISRCSVFSLCISASLPYVTHLRNRSVGICICIFISHLISIFKCNTRMCKIQISIIPPLFKHFDYSFPNSQAQSRFLVKPNQIKLGIRISHPETYP